jgi:predicted AlkP superfamily phosphohydrolase/phosphomutase
MLSNSVVAAFLGASYILVLVLHLNPTLPLTPRGLLPLALTVGLFYSVHLTVILYGGLVLRQLLARELFAPAWASVAVLSWLCAAAASAGAALMWANLRTFTLVLPDGSVDHLARGMLALIASACLFAAVGQLRAQFPDLRRVWAVLLVMIAISSVAVPLALRGRASTASEDTPRSDADVETPVDAPAGAAPAERPSRVTVLAIDAASLDLITAAAADGRLPNFGRVLDAGAVMHLATIHPTSAEAVWTAVATGKLPQKNGVRSAGVYDLRGGGEPLQLLPDYCFANALVRFGLVEPVPHTASALRARPFWAILTALGIPVGVVGWPLTQPAAPVRGYLVSEAYPRLAATPSAIDDSSSVYPPAMKSEVARALESDTSDPAGLEPAVRATINETPARTDRTFDQIARALAQEHPTRVTVIRYSSLDAVGHYYLRYAMPAAFGDVSDEERRRFGSVLESHYAFIDAAIGRAIGALGPDDLLLVVSGYGMEPLGFGKRLLEVAIGDPDVSGSHEGAPDGFLMAYGASVERARLLPRGSVVDFTPTLLYFLGLPIGRDMDGFARTDLFQRSYTDERPLTFIPTYGR